MKLVIKILSTIISLSIWQASLGQTLITVKQDGMGDFSTIQEGVDAATDGDTVLVWPGVYYEHVGIVGKNIILGSLALIYGDSSYTKQTIIDGEYSGACLEIRDCTGKLHVNGFTVIHGSGIEWGIPCGGGIFIFNSIAEVFNCVVKHNIVEGYGGGIYTEDSEVFFSNTSITKNHSLGRGGGVLALTSQISFDSLNRCNIYLNYAARGTDIYKLGGDDSLLVFVDTFTVIQPDYYYLYYNREGYGFPANELSYDIKACMVESTSDNLYVSPTGCNENSGLSPDDPLENIYYALLKMTSDSISPDTIFLDKGVYSPLSGELFPLSLKRDGNIKGASRDSTILDGNDKIYMMHGIVGANNYQVSNLSLCNGNGNTFDNLADGFGAIVLAYNDNAEFRDVNIYSNTGKYSSSTNATKSNQFAFHNVILESNIGGKAFRTASNEKDTINLINCSFISNAGDDSAPGMGYGGGLTSFGNYAYDNITCYLYNCLFAENHQMFEGSGGANSINIGYGSEAYIINCTFGNNLKDNSSGGNIGIFGGSEMYIYNSILFNNEPRELFMFTPTETNFLHVHNSLVLGGKERIDISGTSNVLNYASTNIDTDPIWDTTSMYPYSLSAGSPCIDAGTLDLPPGVELPETDLAGNPRVYNGYVDMGAYEYGPWVSVPDYYSKPKTQNSKLLMVWPNPFRFETNISYAIPEKGRTIIRVYDLNGRCIKTLMDVYGQAGEGQMRWRGSNDQGNSLQSGTYIISIAINGKEKDAVKVVKR